MAIDWKEEWRDHLIWAEGFRQFPYEDSVGKTTIGVGRNLDDKGLSAAEVRYLLEHDMDDTLADCQKLPYWEELNDARRLVIADMVFNMGYRRFLSFVKTNAALEAGDYSEAAAEMMDSKWYRQTGRRARKLCSIMLWGDLDVSE